MKITKETITRYLNFLNDISSEIKKQNGLFTNKSVMAICNKYSLPWGVFTTAKELGFFYEKTKHNYKIMVSEFQPFHSRQLITEKRRKHALACRKSKVKKEKAEKKIVAPKQNETRIKNVIVHPKTFSILWGLIKFNY